MKATEQYFPVVLFIMPYKVILTFESVDEILKYNHSNESYSAVLSWRAVLYLRSCSNVLSPVIIPMKIFTTQRQH